MDIKLLPSGGIDNQSDSTSLVGDGIVYLRDAVNVNVSGEGRIEVRKSGTKVSENVYRWLWQSPLHGDVFGLHGTDWVKVNPLTWTHEVLISNAGVAQLYHDVLNNKVIVAAGNGVFAYNGVKAEPLTIDTPPSPLVAASDGVMPASDYQFAVAWLRGDIESAMSELTFFKADKPTGVTLTLPMPLDPTITSVRIYISHNNGMDVQLIETLPIGQYKYSLITAPALGRVSPFKHLSPIPTGKYLCQWNGRIWNARANVIRFSEAMAYHLHDERHGFIQMPQAITFLEPVDDGIWVGQRDHVAFLRGNSPDNFVLERKTRQSPIEGSAVRMSIDTTEQAAGRQIVVWLSSDGYMAGLPDGIVAPYQASRLTGISAKLGSSVRLDKRLFTIVS